MRRAAHRERRHGGTALRTGARVAEGVSSDGRSVRRISYDRTIMTTMRHRTLCALAVGVAMLAPALAAQQQSGGIVFVGSSVFHRWTSLVSQMAPLPIINLAFDGSQTTDMLRVIDSRVIPLRPKVIAYYCGSNDIDA